MTHKIVLTDKNTSFEYKRGESVLSSLEKSGQQLDFSCRMGMCGCCKTKLIEGEVEYFEAPIADLMEGEILPCICRPTTDIKLKTKRSGKMITIYSIEDCPNCEQAKKLCTLKKKEYEAKMIGEDISKEDLEAKAGTMLRAAPVIFVDDEYIGTLQDLMKHLMSS